MDLLAQKWSKEENSEAIPALYMRTLQELEDAADRFWNYSEGRLIGLGNECNIDSWAKRGMSLTWKIKLDRCHLQIQTRLEKPY